MRRSLKRFWTDPSGATAIEYGLIAGLIFLVILAAVQALATAGTGVFNTAMSAIDGAIN